MAHYALIDSSNIVVQVITGVDENEIQFENGQPVGGSTEAWEQFYETRPWFAGLKCKRTSYNNNFRKRFAGVGMSYSEEYDIFVGQKPFPSWIFDEVELDWVSPVPRPENVAGFAWFWNEENLNWESVDLISDEFIED